MIFVKFENVYKRYKMGEITINAADGVSFEIEKGEFAVIVGASGAGKPTILNMLGGMDTCDEGTILLDGEKVSGFDKKRLFYTQGDYGLFQCSEPCCQETFDNEAAIREMVKRQQNMKVPTELLPVCPHCGKPMTMNLRCDDTFVEDEGWHKAAERYENFLRTRSEQKILFLELGVGYNTPTIVKYSFWRMAHDWKDATYACLNYGEAYAPDEIRKKSICINGDIGEILSQI